jgi:very-short-patch-repair endonuclease
VPPLRGRGPEEGSTELASESLHRHTGEVPPSYGGGGGSHTRISSNTSHIIAQIIPLNGRVNEFARTLRKNATEAERFLWSYLRRRQLDGFYFRRQRPVGPYTCDFVCMEASLIVELDGSQHVERTPYDAVRDAFLRSHGFRVIRFWNADLFRDADSVVATIYEALHRPEMDGRFE